MVNKSLTCVLVFMALGVASGLASQEVLATVIVRNWQHSGGDDAQFESWLFDGISFEQVNPSGDAHYTGSYETPWSEAIIDLRLAIAIQTPPPIILPPPIGIRTQTWQPYISRWPESISLQLFNFDAQSYDVSVLTPYTGGTLGNNADFPMAANLVHPLDAAHSDQGYIRVRYDLIFRDDFDSLAYARAHTLEFSGGNQLTGTPAPVPEPSSYALDAIGLLGLGVVGWRRRAS